MHSDLYDRFNLGLLEMRETFHRTGRLDDSNTKLDEIVKLLCIEVSQLHGIPKGLPSLADTLDQFHFGKKKSLVAALNETLERVARSPLFRNADGESLLGNNPRLSIPETENEIAEQLVSLIISTFDASLHKPQTQENFELLNEVFGHFIRDNFRNNIEDAQYMTPPEVVTYMCRIAADELSSSSARKSAREIIVADPSCGVGSFLAQCYAQFRRDDRFSRSSIILAGQDKVDRMARLAKLNLLLFKTASAEIYRGNSLIAESPFDAYSSRCDLILTNPPFGARFPARELRQHSTKKYPLLSDIIESSNSTIDSELLFLDRYYDLLKPGGVVLAVLPDAVISAAGLPSVVRERISKSFAIRSITELPSVTFGQAGTRTKTCILHLQKTPAAQKAVFVASAKQLGFEVASRKGVPVKRVAGSNDLNALARAFARFSDGNGYARAKVLSENPSAVTVPPEILRREGWTPNHHSAVRHKTLKALSKSDEEKDYEIVHLRDLVLPLARMTSDDQQLWDTLGSRNQSSLRVSETADDWSESKCISVLHVGDFGFLNIRELLNYRPKYPGQPCRAGDVLFSKINPRIPRVVVVPKLPVPLTCSTEFEVLRVKPDFSSFALALLLLSKFAQNQILSLTSGTSSSHNRIKTAQLLDVRLPMPKSGTRAADEFAEVTKRFEKAQQRLQQSAYDSYESLVVTDRLLGALIN